MHFLLAAMSGLSGAFALVMAVLTYLERAAAIASPLQIGAQMGRMAGLAIPLATPPSLGWIALLAAAGLIGRGLAALFVYLGLQPRGPRRGLPAPPGGARSRSRSTLR